MSYIPFRRQDNEEHVAIAAGAAGEFTATLQNGRVYMVTCDDGDLGANISYTLDDTAPNATTNGVQWNFGSMGPLFVVPMEGQTKLEIFALTGSPATTYTLVEVYPFNI